MQSFFQKMNQSSISYYKFDDKSSCIIASLPQRNDVQVIYIDQVMGTPLFYGIKGYDVFDSKESAYKFVSRDRKPVQSFEACSILGYVFSDKCCHLILIKKEKPLFPLFDKHMINAIEKVTFIDIPTEISCPQSAIVNINLLKKYPFNHSHYYCPTLDLSKDFGSRTKVVRTCWNQKLIYPFKRFLSLVPNLCVSVFQGVANYTSFVEINTGILFMSSRLFPPIFPKTWKHHSIENGVTCNEYIIDIYLIKTIENDFEVLNHTIQVGDFPFNWTTDQNNTKCVIENIEDRKKSTNTFIKRQKNLFNYDYINFVNFMNRPGIENNLTESLNSVLTELFANKPNNKFIEQNEIEWIQSIKNKSLLGDLVQNYWPNASSKIKKFGFTRSLITNISNNQANFYYNPKEYNPYQCNCQSYQKGISRFLFHTSFDREILGLFFYIMKLLEIMCLDEFNFNFPEKLVIPIQLKSFKYGFEIFTAKFLLEFNIYLSNFANLSKGDLSDLIYEYMNSQMTDIDSYQINLQSFLEASHILINVPAPPIFAVTQSPSSFVMTKNVGNQILQPNSKGLIEIPLERQPLVLCLSEHCYIKYLIIKNTNANQISILGGYRLNRTIKIASKVIIPMVPKNDSKNSESCVFVNLESRAAFYDNEMRPHEFEKIRFLILKFKTFQNDNLKIGNIFAYGSNKLPSLLKKKANLPNIPTQNAPIKVLSSDPSFNSQSKDPKDIPDPNLNLQISQTETALLEKEKEKNELHPQNTTDQTKSNDPQTEPLPQNSLKSSQKSPQSSKDKGTPEKNSHKPSEKTRVEKIIQNEMNRIQRKEDYFEYQKRLISKGHSLDSYDLEKILNPDKTEKEARKVACTKCQTKDMCNDCVYCKRPFCKKCLKTMTIKFKELTFCANCLNKWKQNLLEIDKLKMLQFESVKEKYPFISVHNDQTVLTKTKPLIYLNFTLSSSISTISDFSGFDDINRPLLSTFAFEPPISPKNMARLPECLFTSNVSCLFESNFANLTVIFTTESKVLAVHVACFSKLEFCIEGANPSQLIFEPPGSIQKVEFVGRMANLVLRGNKIDLRNIRFFGIPVFQKEEQIKNENLSLLSSKQRLLAKILPLSCQFSKELNSHDLVFNSTYKFVGIKFSSTLLLPNEIIIEFKNEKSVEYLHHQVARITQNSTESQTLGIILLDKPMIASKVKICYPRLPQRLAAAYTMEIPEMLVKHDTKQSNK